VLFNSLTFFLFFAVVLTLHHLPLPWWVKKLNLLLASYLFYAAWNPPFVLLLWVSTLTDWFAARAMAASDTQRRRRAMLFISLGVNLGLLGYFKYAGFLLENFVQGVGALGIQFHPALPDIILPLGISFYTFQTLSYTISIYRRESEPSRSFLDYALYVTFFPQLVAGPIVRATEFLPQCLTPRRADAQQMGWGLSLLTFGLFQKVVLADAVLAPVVDTVYREPAAAGFIDAWIGTLAFSGQIFFDFAGYSSCAIGVALCLGFVLPENFRCPYGSLGFSDFWRRWHVSLSTWLRDYVYISLGGNRLRSSRTAINLMLTMLVGGLWHGAAWHFVVWGALHGAYLVIERSLRQRTGDLALLSSRVGRCALALFTFAVVTMTWAFFRAQSLEEALQLVAAMFGASAGSSMLVGSQILSVAGVMAVTFAVQWRLRDVNLDRGFTSLPVGLRAAALAVLIISIFLAPGDDRAFLYFQF